ncbi:MAG: MarR family transcriptional regulator, partial [Pseudomonadota bacterium]
MSARGARRPGVDETRVHLRLWLRMLKVSRHIEATLRDRLRTEFQSTLPRFDVMAALNRFPEGLRMSELSGVLRVSNGNVTGIVDRLVNDGLVQRRAVPGDRRAQVVALTKQGRAEFERHAAAHHAWVDELLAGIPADDAEHIIACL